MSDFSLYHRITEEGTLLEPSGVPKPNFSLPSTINWMRCLAILVQDEALDFKTANIFYSRISRKTSTNQEQNTIFQQLLFAIHQVSALQALKLVPNKADVARVGIVAWYYGIYAAASAMITAQDGSFQEDHTGTATAWSRQFAMLNLLMHPFNLKITSLEKKKADSELGILRTHVNTYSLTSSSPIDKDDAYSGCISYLSGNVDWWTWKICEDLKTSADFKKLGVADFRTKKARDLRDKKLINRNVTFLHQAIRYRGKANYREALYLGYGSNVKPFVENYIDDLYIVLSGFVAMAGTFCSKRLGKSLWGEFVANLEAQRAFSTSLLDIWK